MYNNLTMNNILASKKIDISVGTNAAMLVETLLQQGVSSIFGYPGASVLSVYNELKKTNKIKHYLVRHEQAAVHAAEGYARISGKAGVVLVTSGPGFTNTITGIANAYADSTPLVILAGDVPTTSKNHAKIFQNVDIGSMTKTCCKKTFIINSQSNIKSTIEEAFYTATTGIKGPVVVVLPRNILEAKFVANRRSSFIIPKNNSNDFSKDIKKLTTLINNSKRPLLLIGGGCINSSEEIKAFVEKLKCPVVSTLMGIGIFPSENNLYLGMIGQNGIKQANYAIRECDLLICLGVAFSNRTTCKNTKFAPNAKIVNINITKTSQKVNLEILADIKKFLAQFLKSDFKYNKDQNDLSKISWLKNEENDTEFCNSKKLQSSLVLKTISEFTKSFEPIVVTDVGQHQMLTAQFFNFNKPAKFITSGGMGTMGFGLPASIGAYIANPNNLILNITGDGSFQMNLQELATCREHNIPIKIIILNNGYLGMVRELQEKIYESRYQVEMTNPDFTKIAEAYDLFAVRVETQNQLIPALEKAINHAGCAIIDISIDSFESI